MKKQQKGFIVPVVIVIVLLLILAGVFFSSRRNSKTGPVINNDTEKVLGLSDADFIKAVDNPEAVVMARGDLNNDGYEDAIVQSMHCGASCGVDLLIVLNQNNSIAKTFEPTDYLGFEPAYKGSGAVKSDLSSVTIKDGIISLTGIALGCPGDFCDDENQNIVRKVTYRFDGQKIVQLSIETVVE